MKEENHEYNCDVCKHRHECVRVSAFLMANVYPYSDECECFEKEAQENEKDTNVI